MREGYLMSPQTVTPIELQRMIDRGEPVQLIDVRTPAEFRELHALGARCVPLDRLDPAAFGPGTLYFICRSGGRGEKACQRLLAAGRADVANVEGGTLAWEAAGLPVHRDRRAVSLERQVRIAAGLLVLLGVGLRLFVHPYLLGLAAFVGAGLVFAGVTDTCGMGMLLARLPWNQAGRGASCASGNVASH
jgi:rhodanese-related sulfurtransferase